MGTYADWSAVDAVFEKQLLVASRLLAAVVDTGASRHVASSIACALFQLVVGDPALTAKKVQTHEDILACIEKHFGPGTGIGHVSATLKANGYNALAGKVSSENKDRRSVAHPTASNIVQQLDSAFNNCHTLLLQARASNIYGTTDSNSDHALDAETFDMSLAFWHEFDVALETYEGKMRDTSMIIPPPVVGQAGIHNVLRRNTPAIAKPLIVGATASVTGAATLGNTASGVGAATLANTLDDNLTVGGTASATGAATLGNTA